MRLAKVKFEQKYVPTPDELAQINGALLDPESAVELNVDGEIPWWTPWVVDMDKMPLVPFKIEKVLMNDAPLGIDTNTAGRRPFVNQKVNVQVPGLGLLMLDHVRVLTDCCTDNLNSYLGKGWRIVAVCPQPDQRRPDYVIGRVRQADED